MQISIVYDSKTGNTQEMARYLIEDITSIGGMETKAFFIDNIDAEYVKNSCGLIVGTPTYNGYPSARMKAWLESGPVALQVAGKLGSAYATAAFIHGGGDLAIQCILTHLMVDGMMTYSGGQSYGMPVIHLGPVAIAPQLEQFADLFRTYGQRMATQAAALFRN